MAAQPLLQKKLKELAKRPGNTTCADCSSPAPTWASFNLGIFLCMECAGHHRGIGVHITQVRSMTLDSWTPIMVANMERVGNTRANSVWQGRLDPRHRIGPAATAQQRDHFIRSKYVTRSWFLQGAAEGNDAAAAAGPRKQLQPPAMDERERRRLERRGMRSAAGAGAASVGSASPSSAAAPVCEEVFRIQSAQQFSPCGQRAPSLPPIGDLAPEALFSGLSISPQNSSSSSSGRPPATVSAGFGSRSQSASPWVTKDDLPVLTPSPGVMPAANGASLFSGLAVSPTSAASAPLASPSDQPSVFDGLMETSAVQLSPATSNPLSNSVAFDLLGDAPPVSGSHASASSPVASPTSQGFDFLTSPEAAQEDLFADLDAVPAPVSPTAQFSGDPFGSLVGAGHAVYQQSPQPQLHHQASPLSVDPFSMDIPMDLPSGMPLDLELGDLPLDLDPNSLGLDMLGPDLVINMAIPYDPSLVAHGAPACSSGNLTPLDGFGSLGEMTGLVPVGSGPAGTSSAAAFDFLH